jgi:2',3'-cyclic-nucleotide 2'-phosphodiesterase (5'-nucleotidase family)
MRNSYIQFNFVRSQRFGRLARLTAGILLILLIVSGCGGTEATRDITIVYTNDLHGHILPERMREWSNKTGGYAVFAAWLKGIRQENEKKKIPTILLDAGDIFTGTVEGSITRGRDIVRLMNQVGYDAMTLGNHEFDYGFYNLQQLAKSADFPFLGANVHRKKTNQLLAFSRPYIIKKYDGLTVGIIGVTTAEVPSITLARNVGQVIFLDPISTVQAYQKLLCQEGVDILVVLSHLGLEEDKKLARAVPKIDLIIGGHSHDLLVKPIRIGKRNTLICQAGCYGRFTGRLDLQIDTDRNKIADYRANIFTNRQYSLPADLETNQVLEDIKKEVGDKYNQVVGLAMEDINNASDAESPLGDLITDAVRDRAGVDVAFQNPYGIRSDLLEGEITRRDIFKILPFDDTIITMKLSGRNIRDLMEQSLTLRKGLLQISGLRVAYDMDLPEGRRALKIMIDGEPLEDKKDYTVATNGFLAEGGDFFESFKDGSRRRDTGILLRDATMEYIRSHAPIYLKSDAERRWVDRQ